MSNSDKKIKAESFLEDYAEANYKGYETSLDDDNNHVFIDISLPKEEYDKFSDDLSTSYDTTAKPFIDAAIAAGYSALDTEILTNDEHSTIQLSLAYK